MPKTPEQLSAGKTAHALIVTTFTLLADPTSGVGRLVSVAEFRLLADNMRRPKTCETRPMALNLRTVACTAARLGVVLGLTTSLFLSSTRPASAQQASNENSQQIRRRATIPDLPSDAPADHPLRPVIALALDSYQRIRTVQDYTCVLVRRERIQGRLRRHEFAFAKVRQRQTDGQDIVVPFSVYLMFLKPEMFAGREVLYVENQNDGKLLARRGGTRFAFVTTIVEPDDELI